MFYQALRSGSDAHSHFTWNHRFSYLLIGPLSIPNAPVWTINYVVTLNIAMLPKIFCHIIPFLSAGSCTHTPGQPAPSPGRHWTKGYSGYWRITARHSRVSRSVLWHPGRVLSAGSMPLLWWLNDYCVKCLAQYLLHRKNSLNGCYLYSFSIFTGTSMSETAVGSVLKSEADRHDLIGDTDCQQLWYEVTRAVVGQAGVQHREGRGQGQGVPWLWQW